MGKDAADLAIDLAMFAQLTRERIDNLGGVECNRHARSLAVICITVESAIMSGEIDRFADHCLEFTRGQARDEAERN